MVLARFDASEWLALISVCVVGRCELRAYSIIGSGSGFTVNLGSDSLGKSNDFRRI